MLAIILLLLCFPSSYQQHCNHEEEVSLLSFSASISTSSFPPLNWSLASNCCSWEGIECNVDHRVIALRLHSRGLEGKISSSINNLVSLTHLDLSNNRFSGSLPIVFFESLSSLETLNLSFNYLDGNFSTSNGGLLPTTILAVDISNNNFFGQLESTLFLRASNLSSFNCSKNNFSDFIPSSMCTTSPQLRSLDFSDNTFTGPIPSTIRECSNLQVFRASNNLLCGSIPWEIGELSLLEELNLDSNGIGGHIPTSLMNCTNMLSLILRRNNLEGEISTLNFSRLARLQKLDLSRNMFNGTFPDSVCSCKDIVALRVASNNLTSQIPTKITQLKSLSFLSLTNNSFTNITSTLKILAACKNLSTLVLGYNFYSETLPSDRSFLSPNEFQNLQFLSLVSCNFSGYFPEWISYMKNLRILQLSHNRFSGTIPKWLGTQPKLLALELYNNFFSGEIPRELCLLPALLFPNMSNLNHLHFELPVYSIYPGRISYDQFKDYSPQISLQNNRIYGEIPSDIGTLKNLRMLYLNGNYLSGEIPTQISSLSNLEQLSLAQNYLSGEIPSSLRSLNFLSIFNVSYNDLQGPIPTGGQFNTFEASSYDGNQRLCGQILQHPCDSVPVDQPKNDEGNLHRRSFVNGFIVGIASGFSTILVIVASYIWFRFKKPVCLTSSCICFKIRH